MPQMLDPTFYRSPAEAIAAPPERLAYVAAYDPAGKAKDAMAVLDVDRPRPPTGRWWAGRSCPRPATSCTTSAGTPALSALCHQGHSGHGQPLERRYLIVPGIRSSRIYVLDTKPDPRQPKVVRDHRGRGTGRQGRLLPPPHHPLRTRRHLRVQPRRGQRQRRARRGRPAGPRHLRRHRRLGARPRRPVLRLRRLVAPEPRHHDHLRVGHALDDRERPQPRGPAREALWPPPQLLVDVPAHPHPADRPGRPAPDGVRGPPGPRPGQGLGVRRGSHQRRGPVGIGVALVPRRGPVGGPQGHHHPGRARRPRPAPPGAQALRGGAAAGVRHRPVGGRPLAVRVVLGHRRAEAVRRQRHLQPARDRVGASSAAFCAASPTPPRRTCRWAAGPRWWRSAGTAAGSM